MQRRGEPLQIRYVCRLVATMNNEKKGHFLESQGRICLRDKVRVPLHFSFYPLALLELS